MKSVLNVFKKIAIVVVMSAWVFGVHPIFQENSKIVFQKEKGRNKKITFTLA